MCGRAVATTSRRMREVSASFGVMELVRIMGMKLGYVLPEILRYPFHLVGAKPCNVRLKTSPHDTTTAMNRYDECPRRSQRRVTGLCDRNHLRHQDLRI